MMSTKPGQIDLNADVVSVDRENEFYTPLIGDSVAETLTECSKDQGQVPDTVVDKLRVCDSGEVICDLNIGADDVNMSTGGFEREVDVLDSVIDVEKRSERLDRGIGVETEDNIVRCDNDVPQRDENEVEATQVAERASGEVEVNRDMNATAVGEILEQQAYAMENSSSLDNDAIQSPTHKSEEVPPDGMENRSLETDALPEYNEDQLVDIHISEVETSSDVLNESYGVNLEVDLNSFCTKDANMADRSTKLIASNPEFCASDLVWGKVRSHPWWPGQIFTPSAASQKAKKYFKKDSYLIAYFGDQTFAWNEPSKIKPFQEHFAQMENQSSSDDFHGAVDCALEEVSRRVEFGLACSCIPEDAFAKIKTQMIVNAGIKKEFSTRDGGDNYSNADSFDPLKLFEHVKALAQLLYYSGDNRLEFVTVRAQLSAFYRWKGYLQLPEFNVLGGLQDFDAEVSSSGEVKHSVEEMQNAAPDFEDEHQLCSGLGKSNSQDGSCHKRKQISGDGTRPSKKEKSLLDLLAERHTNMSNDKRGFDGKSDKLVSSPSNKKRKAVDFTSDDIAVEHKKLDAISDDVTMKHKRGDVVYVKREKSDLSDGPASKCLSIKQTFGVGNSILKVASQLNGSSLVLKCGDGTSPETIVKNTSKEKSVSRNSQSKKRLLSEVSTLDDFLSQLCLAARDPMTGYNSLISLVSFFSEFRNSVSLEQSDGEVSGDRTMKTLTKCETSERPAELVKDSYWTDRVIESIPEEQESLENKNEAGEVLQNNPSQKKISPVEGQPAVQLSGNLESGDSGQQTDGQNSELKAVEPADPLDGSCNKEASPTALILNFTDSESVPSRENLNNIFSRFGPLNELETEVFKSKRAKVVFKRRADAEAAFSSAGKYSIFGPALVSYCLKYMSSTPIKAASRSTKRSRKVATSVEGNSS